MAAKNINTKTLEQNFDGPAVQMFLGETILSKANVIRYYDASNHANGSMGTLYITNFKIAFMCSATNKSKTLSSEFNKKSSEEPSDLNDLIPLTVILNIYAVSTLKGKRKKLKNALSELSSQYDIIEIDTKDFRMIQFDFKYSASQNRRSCFQMISHYAFPTTVLRLFAFDYASSVASKNDSCAFCYFKTKKDYELNINRLHASQNWRVTNVNEEFAINETLPKFLVCPASLEDSDIEQIAGYYNKKRFPVWVWSDPYSGCSLLISAHLRSSLSKDNPVNHPLKLLNSLKASSSNKETIAVDLNSISDFPTLKQLQVSFQKIYKLSTFHSTKEFWNSDPNWLSGIEESGWLHYVSSCLSTAKMLAEHIAKKHLNVLIEENGGHDFSILIASLVQIMLDPYYRTLLGLKALIQKDWVLKGHPFSTRLGTLSTPFNKKNDYNGQSPVFLLFLDCLHQLITQYPLLFEYMDQYLVLIMDCAYSSLFETFIFNSEKEYEKYSKDLKLVSVWDFLETNIPDAKFNLLFTNFAFKLNNLNTNDFTISSSASDGLNLESIFPASKVSDVAIWSKYFFRWLSIIHEDAACCSSIVLQLQQMQFDEEVEYLTHRLAQLQHDKNNSVNNVSLTNQPKKKQLMRNCLNSYEEVKKDLLNATFGFHLLKLI